MSDYLEQLTPVIFFINKLSGGQKGEQIYRQLLRRLNPRQVFLLENDATIEQALNIYSSLANTRICICGGDGTVGWVLSRLIENFPPLQNPPASICPLGTGNDLSRVLGWGYQYDSKRFLRMLAQIPHAKSIALDRWQIQIQTLETITTISNNETALRRFFSFRNPPKFIRHADQPLYENHWTPLNMHFFNYMSFGLDAAVVLDFHARRTRDPAKFSSPLKNKVLYVNEARKYFKEFAFGIGWNLGSYIRLICDGKDLTDSIRSCHTLVLLNIPGFGSGTHPWSRTPRNNIAPSSTVQKDGDSPDEYDIAQTTTTTAAAHNNVGRFETQDFADQKLEVLGLNTIQMALIQLGFLGHRIAQCRQVCIELNQPMPVHMDGEPFYLPRSIALHVTHAGQVMVLRNENR
jgi:diacylglycerol kinase (ATP)